MSLNFQKQFGLMSGMALNELKGFTATQLYPIIRGYTGNSFSMLLALLKSASNGSGDDYMKVTSICIAINEIASKPALHALCVYSATVLKSGQQVEAIESSLQLQIV